MRIPRLVCILLPLAAISCQRPAIPASTSQSNSKSDSKKVTLTVTIDGRAATPEEAETFGTLGKNLLSDAIHKALSEGIEKLFKKLDIIDTIEADLLSESFGLEASGGDDLLSVYLIRPAKETKEPRTIVLSRNEKPFIRFTRATSPVERPLAIMSLSRMKDGNLTQKDTFLVHCDGKWKQFRPSESKESIE